MCVPVTLALDLLDNYCSKINAMMNLILINCKYTSLSKLHFNILYTVTVSARWLRLALPRR